MPVAPHAAVIPGKYFHTGMNLCSCSQLLDAPLINLAVYTEAMNMMNYSVVVIPVAKADKFFEAAFNPLLRRP